MIREQIEQLLRETLTPMHLEVINESHMHNVPEGSESHFKVVIVSNNFEGKGLVARHREVNKLLADHFQQGLHALALHTMTPEEWFAKGGTAPESPQCMGGGK
ncbi:MAG: BolA family transcriptional regulator [Sedimenticola sp.]|jgi:BolA protein|nr:MAG: BolA family transcriptional regulator [Sedimenticola sp.]